MQIIVSDSSAIIDLRKGGLLPAFLALPFERVIPDLLFEHELLSLSKSEKTQMARRMEVATLEGVLLQEAISLFQSHRRLSLHDWAALLSARERPGSILLSGDGELRKRAQESSIEVHGVLWIVEQMKQQGVVEPSALIKALQIWRSDSTVRLPQGELSKLIAMLSRK